MEPNDVLTAFTVDQGGNVANACEALGVEVIASATASTPRSCEVLAFRVLRRVARTKRWAT